MDAGGEYEIRIEGEMTARWADWFEGLVIRTEPSGETLLSGRVIDQAALLGVLNKIHALNLRLISVRRVAPGS
jgi:hypothetical protein